MSARGRGRPPSPDEDRRRPRSYSLSEQDAEAIRRLGERLGVSAAEAIRRAVGAEHERLDAREPS